LKQAIRPARVVLRKEIGAAVNDAVGPRQSGLEAELRDLRRVLEDDLDATNETTVVFGRLLARLADRLDDIDARLEALTARFDGMQAPGHQPAGPRGVGQKQRPAASPRGKPRSP